MSIEDRMNDFEPSVIKAEDANSLFLDDDIAAVKSGDMTAETFKALHGKEVYEAF